MAGKNSLLHARLHLEAGHLGWVHIIFLPCCELFTSLMQASTQGLELGQRISREAQHWTIMDALQSMAYDIQATLDLGGFLVPCSLEITESHGCQVKSGQVRSGQVPQVAHPHLAPRRRRRLVRKEPGSDACRLS